MSIRQPLAAGLAVALSGAIVLGGWGFDVTFAKSLMPGWRVMVPSSAFSFLCLGVALALASTRRARLPIRSAAVLLLSVGAVVLPALTLVEYGAGLRFGVETWLGFPVTGETAVAGRMSPLASLCFVMLGVALCAISVPGRTGVRLARVVSGATLAASWLSVLAVSFDTARLSDTPKFPGMAALTIVLTALTSAATLALSIERDSPYDRDEGPRRPVLVLAALFLIPLALGSLQVLVEQRGWIDAQMVTALVAFGFAAAVAAIVLRHAARLSALRHDRERALTELEARVDERTQELATSVAELRKREDELHDADRRKDEFLATLAHELRNPLAPIRNAVAVLGSLRADPANQREAGAIVERQVAQMARLIDDLLDVSRITAGKLSMRQSRVELSTVLHMAVATNRPHLDQAGHRLTVLQPEVPVFIDGDAARLSQVFANLLHNACKYTEPGGEITIDARLVGDAEVEVTVRDNGIGISPAFLPRLFEKFSQVASALDRPQGGLGLGLSLVHGLVALHGGTVVARSAGLGMGSEFIVRLPVASSQLPAHASSPLAPETPLRISRRVLVVDDNEDSAESMAVLLRLQGHFVETAHDGETAIEVARRLQPDAILLDIGMPRLNGFEVCRRIRSEEWGKSVLLVAQTGWGQDQDRRRTHEAGFDGHLTKPIDFAQVQKMLINLKAG